MNNFEARCITKGSSALQPEFDYSSTKGGVVIKFSQQIACNEPPVDNLSESKEFPRCSKFTSKAYLYFIQSEMAQSLRYGSIQGHAYNRVKPWQAVLVGSLFFITSVASLFL